MGVFSIDETGSLYTVSLCKQQGRAKAMRLRPSAQPLAAGVDRFGSHSLQLHSPSTAGGGTRPETAGRRCACTDLGGGDTCAESHAGL